MEMNAQATNLQAAENDLKQLMADVTRAMEKAQEAVARITSKCRGRHSRDWIHDFVALERALRAAIKGLAGEKRGVDEAEPA
jgi:hypothetical protein